MKTRSIHPGLGLTMILTLAAACVDEGDPAAFRGEEHASTGAEGGKTETGEPETGKTESGEDTLVDVGETAGDDGGKGTCPRTQGYWKNHSAYAGPVQNRIPWPISEDTQLCGSSWYDWLHTPPKGGDAWIIFVHQFIAAQLNEAAGADVPDDVADALATAAALLGDCSVSAAERDDAIATSELLDAFNNGAFTESCESGDDGDDGDDGEHDDDGKPCDDDD